MNANDCTTADKCHTYFMNELGHGNQGHTRLKPNIRSLAEKKREGQQQFVDEVGTPMTAPQLTSVMVVL